MYTMIADSNALRHPDLQTYLSLSRDHTIVLSDLTVVEMQKTNALLTSRKSTEILSKYLDQVYLLKRTGDFLEYSVSSAVDVSELYDFQTTLEFRELCRDLRKVPPPDYLDDFMREREVSAATIYGRLQDQVREWEPALMEVAAEFSREELSAIRQRQSVEEKTRRKLFDVLGLTLTDFMLRNQQVPKEGRAKLADFVNMFGLRYSLSILIFYMLWVMDGSTTGKRLDRRTNDVVDLQLAALSTYFSGVLSADGLVSDVAAIVRPILRGWNAYLGEDFRYSPAEET